MKLIALHNNYAAYNNCRQNTLKEDEVETMLYTMPDTALLINNRPFFVPDFAQPCTAELQLVVRICRLGRSISERFAHRYFDALTTAITFTAQNVFENLRQKGAPWEISKGFDGAAAVGEFISVAELPDWETCTFSMHRDGELLQQGCAKDMLMNVYRMIAYVSQFYTLRQGDLLFTGCPVAPVEVQMNQRLQAAIEHRTLLAFNVK